MTAADFRARPEHRWPVVVALLVAVVLYLLLPGAFLPALRYTIAGICLLALVPLIVFNPVRLTRETRLSRRLSIALAVVLLLANQVALVQLGYQLLVAHNSDAPAILLAAVQVWATNVIAYAIIYWELDRGGPVARRRDARDALPPADFRFPQDEDDDAVAEVAVRSSTRADWSPQFFDYLYFSTTDAMAFSPTDVMPLSIRAKALMLLESLSGFVVLALVIARAVNVMGG
ncbi:DUF1345 domain-containing protein [Protaetiibacter intestinalis]|uniref:DUF1345 domain-containing protein n=1 Tax=Protaetiibacter intestinalis TaxID=2419774 RepID=A0A387BDK4_9MICO|nr:DUF1345 domain-containing protein [Protaetiibacter intestinalis]AYF98969.1 DUF1345 domain-containing protein [Protaetiibacter intestinalis]